MSQTTLDSDGNFATEAFQQQVRKFLNTTDVALKARELCRLDAYVEYLAQVEDPNDPAMMELWGSGLFEETIDILSTPMMDDMWGHVKLYRITLMILNDILLSPWIHNSQARALMKSRAAVILDEQGFVYGLPMGEESKPKFRELLLGLFGDLLTEFADDDLGDKLDGSVLLGLAFDYYFGITPPSQDDESAIGANIILLKYSRESFGGEPAPYLHDVLVQHGEKHIADRYIEIAENAGETQLLSSHSSWELLARLISAKPLQMRLLEDAKVHMSVMTNTWKEAYEDPDLSPKIARRVLIIITQMITEIEAPLRSSFVQDLVQTDLILLFGRALLAEQDIGHIRGIVKTLVTYCQLRSHAKSELARLEWIHVWRSLNSSRRSKTDTLQRRSLQAAMRFWLELGLEVLAITLDSYWTGSPNSSDFQACGWIKCPRFGDVWQSGQWDTPLLPSRCTACYRATYCSTVCQKLDWKEGNHKKICKRLAAAGDEF